MLTFLRKIRKSLVDTDATRKYLLYAIGEIALVVIGILIALQINNWNERRKVSILEKEYLLRVEEDMKVDTAYYAIRLNEADRLLSNQYNFIHEIYQPQETFLDYRRIMKFVEFPPLEMTIQNTTYVELVNSGNINLFKNIELRKAIIGLYQEFNKSNKHIAEYDVFTANNLNMINEKMQILKYLESLRETLPWDEEHMYRKKDWKYINEPESEEFQLFEQTVGLYYNKTELFKDYVQELLLKTIYVLDLINKELGRDEVEK